MKCFFYVLILILFAANTTNAQSVAINTTGATANTSAILDISSNSKGVLVPRMTKAQKNAIGTPAIGLLVYQALPDSVGFHYYNGTVWVWLQPSSGAGNDWSLTGNAGTDTATNFIGTTDNMPIRLKQNDVWIGQFNRNNDSYFIGELSGKSNTTGSKLTGMGDSVLFSNTTGTDNVGVGNRALAKNTSGIRNVAIGSAALRSSTVSGFNVAVGANALTASNGGDENVAVGDGAMEANTTGVLNNSLGSSALASNTTGFQNTAIGAYSLFSNTVGIGNAAMGFQAGFNNTNGDYNIAVGDNSLYANSTGNNNIAVGRLSVFSNISSSGLIGIGRSALQTVTASSNLIAIGDSALYANTTGLKNIAIGNSTLSKNVSGVQNLAIGHNALKSNITGIANIAIGDSALSASTVNWNIAIGRNALLETTIGGFNIAVGDGALSNNTTGTNNVAIGYGAQVISSSNNKNNTSLGHRSGWSMNGYSNTIIGGDAMGKPAVTYTVNNTVAVGDSVLFNIATGANSNTAIGTKTLFSNTTGQINTAVGAMALHDNTTGSYNVALGDSAAANSATISNLVAIGSKALQVNSLGTGHTSVGYHSLFNNTTGSNNAAFGNNALLSNIIGSNNTAIGNLAGQGTFGSGNVFIGYSAGATESGSNKLYIDNSNTTSPLIYGDFTTNLLRVNGTLDINNAYTFPVADGTANQVLQTNGAGAVNWATISAGGINTANNGLTLTASNVALGGSLVSNTTISHGNFNLTHSLSGSGDFLITTPTRPGAFTVLNTGDVAVNSSDFMVSNTGNVGVNSGVPSARLHVVNSTSGGASNYNSGIFVENTAGAAGQALLSFKNFVLPGNRAWITGLNTFDNYVIAYGDSLSATNVVLRVDTAGYVGVNPGGSPNSRLDVTGSFGNAIRITTVTTTLNEDDHTLVIGPAAGAITITLPAAAGTGRREYVIVNRSGSLQTVSSYLDFSGTSTSVPANSAITIQSNGTSWFRIR